MDNFEEKVWNYGLLSSSEQEAVEVFVEQHPALVPTLDAVKGLYELVEQARLMRADPPGDVAIAYYVAHEHMRHQPAPAGLESVYKQLAAKVEEDREIKERYDAIKLRMEEVASQSDPVGQFERLTGIKLNDIPLANTDKSSFQPGRKERPPVVRKHKVARSSRWIKYAALSSMAAVIIIIALVNTNRLDRLAYTEAEVLFQFSESVLRNAESPSDAIASERLIGEGVAMMFKAQHNRFDLYYSFDGALLDKAEEKFLEVLSRDGVDVGLVQKTKFLLAKVYLAKGKKEEAKAMLNEVRTNQIDYWAERADKLFQNL